MAFASKLEKLSFTGHIFKSKFIYLFLFHDSNNNTDNKCLIQLTARTFKIKIYFQFTPILAMIKFQVNKMRKKKNQNKLNKDK
ncbi:hypothetical protein BpHYR1_000762 [Brachionus plicatilis]|uniref:Uncharacterized protein n=1 Tax=Brachionus plicatilis TaxID=10195 RepID=A0A3M7RTI6_BRAPC|nr:hypothetical protein BpHYR1_000762 [Brachionus plicatilis]